jgi:hypothetical protein
VKFASVDIFAPVAAHIVTEVCPNLLVEKLKITKKLLSKTLFQ